MATTVNIHDAKTNLSRLIAEVERGGEVIIARAGTPCARLVSIESAPRQLGQMADRWPQLDDGFFAPLDGDEVAAWDS
jgi:prevent-host-death family protein